MAPRTGHSSRRRPISLGVGIIAAAVFAAGFVVLQPSRVTGAVGDVGVPGPSYRGAGAEPAGSKPESKLWWNDGSWWGSLWSARSRDHHIFRLEPAVEKWIDTGVRVDSRSKTRADALWDGNKLYVASHVFGKSPAPGHPARLHRYSYDPATKRYSLDSGFPTTINDFRSETLVIDKDSTGRLWATWVQGRSVYVTHTTDGDRGWATPFVLPVSGAAALTGDDISSVVAFGGSKVGVMWSDQKRNSIFFAVHLDGQPASRWQPVEIALGRPFRPDDHINVKADSEGRVFAVVRTQRTSATAPQVLLLARTATGTWSRHTFGTSADKHGRAILLLDEENDRMHVFATSPENNGTVYAKAASLRAPSFAPGIGTPFLRSTTSATMNNATSTKQTLSGATGAVVVGGLGSAGRYWHNTLELPTRRKAGIEADLVGSPTSGYAPLTVSFSDRSSAGETGRTWNFGDGSHVSTEADPVHTYDRPGSYTVTLTVWNGKDSEHARTRLAYVTVLPLDAEFSSSRTSGRVPLYVRFTDESSGTIVSRLWDFGDGTTSTDANPAKVYRSGGLYTVRLTVTDRAGRSVTRTRAAHVNALPLTADFSAAPLVGPAPLTAHFSDDTLGSPTQWLWDFGDGATSSERSPTHVYTDPGAYTVSLTVTDAAGTTNTRTRWAYVKAEQLTADFIGQETIGPAPLVVVFTDRSDGRPVGWTWDFGDGTPPSSVANPTHRYRTPGAYTVRLTVRDAGGDSSTRRKTSYVTATSDFVVRPAGDTEVRSAHADANWGSAATIGAGTRARRGRAYLAFDVPTLPGTLVSARLRLFVTNSSVNGGDVYSVANDWTEWGLTWANAPAITGSPLATIGNSRAGTWVEAALPIGTFAGGPGRYAFALTQAFAASDVAFASREASVRRRPQLVLAVDYGPKNTPPAARGDIASTDEDTRVVVDVAANDDPGVPDESDESVALDAITAAPAHGTAWIEKGSIAYIPRPDYFGSDTLAYRVCDSGADRLCSTARLRVSVLPVNDPPRAADDAISMNEDFARILALVENDVAGPGNEVNQTLSIEAVTSPPEHGRVRMLAGKAVYTSAPGYNGPDTLAYRVCDDGIPRLCAEAKGSISIAAVNDAPRAAADVTVTDEDLTTLVPVLANDNGGGDDEAAQGLRIGGIVSPPAHGKASVEGDGVRYSPDHDYHGRDTFAYSVCDDGDPSLCATGVVDVDVLSVNDLPAARDDAAVSDEDSHVAVEVLANDGPGELEQFIQLEHLLSPPAHGTAEIDNGRVIYTPTPDYNGPDELSYRACDNGTPRFCVEASVALTVVPVNDPPRADPDTAVVQEELPALIPVLADDDAGPNDEDAEGLFIDGIAARPNHGRATVGAGWVRYTPDADYAGRDWFSYRLCDGGDPSLCAIGVVEIEVIFLNDVPRPRGDAGTVTGGAPISLEVLRNDDAGADETGQVLQLAGIVWSPLYGKAIVDAGRIVYMPSGDYHGYDSLVYRACDDGSPERCSTGTVAIRLLPGVGAGPRLQYGSWSQTEVWRR